MPLRALLAVFLTAASANAAEYRSADAAFSLELPGGDSTPASGNTVLEWSGGRGVRLTVQRLDEPLDPARLLERAKADAYRLKKKGSRLGPTQWVRAEVPFAVAGGRLMSFGYFNAAGASYSFLVKGVSRRQAGEWLSSLRESASDPEPAPAEAAPAPVAPPAAPAATDAPAELPAAEGTVTAADGLLEFPKTAGWRFLQQDDGWFLIEGRDWSFALSRRAITEVGGSEAGTPKELAAGFFARFELDFVENRGCAAAPIAADQFENGWRVLSKTYACPGMSASRRQIVGVVLPGESPLVAWTGDYDRAESYLLFLRWLASGREAPKTPAKQSPALLLAAIGGAIGFTAVLLLMIWRRRRQRAAEGNP
jgi:hypothetical protein